MTPLLVSLVGTGFFPIWQKQGLLVSFSKCSVAFHMPYPDMEAKELCNESKG